MSSPAAIVCFGETLWDMLPTGRQPGGAPCNLALHLHELGQPVQLISRVGDDELGHELLGFLTARGLNLALVQRSASHLTGVVKANLPDGSGGPITYKIVHPLAWDYIQHTDELRTAVSQARMLVYGTLAARSPVSRETLYRLLQHASFKVLDLNLRAPHYSREVVKYLLRQADLVKLNEAELAEIMPWLGQPATPNTALPWLAAHFNLQAVCLTRGAAGATLWTGGRACHSAGYAVADGAPAAIGSGDAFLAALLAGWATALPPAENLRRACAAGAAVASGHGPGAVFTATHLQVLPTTH